MKRQAEAASRKASHRTREEEVRRNLIRLQLFRGLLAADLLLALWVPFYQEVGLSQTQIFVCLSTLAVCAMLVEIPSGWFADRYGRRRSLILGVCSLFVAYTVLGQAYDFWAVLIGESILGVGYSFVGGADRAMAYDFLKSIGREKEEGQRFEAVGTSYFAAGAILASLTGTWVATQLSFHACLWLQLLICALLLGLALRLREPEIIIEDESEPAGNKRLLVLVWRSLREGRELRWILSFYAVTITAIMIINLLRPVYYQQVGVPLGWFGALAMVELIGLALAARLADRVSRYGSKKVFCAFTTVLTLSSVALAMLSGIWWTSVFLGPVIVCGVCQPIFTNYVNRLATSEVRAIVFSLKNMISRLCFCVISPMVGMVADSFSLAAAYGFVALVFGAMGAGILIMMVRVRLL